MQTFLHPLTPKEEARQLSLLKEGTPEEANAAKEMLIEHNLRLVAHIIKKYQISDEEPDDLLSIGTIGLIKAIGSFDESKGKLATYACRCIENEILMLLRGKKKTARDVSLYETIGQDKEGNEIQLMDVIEQNQMDACDRFELSENVKKLREMLQTLLTKREREIMILRYGLVDGEEKTQSQIGKRMGISRSYVSRIEKRALGKLRRGFQQET
ncbi:MAG: RNA polymerase sporulation sigma factor SigK [Lachnospiraceae bacterium]|nr:RNA polymerase sporulation sigma factor SigK [Lachnospiraceae bacterium]